MKKRIRYSIISFLLVFCLVAPGITQAEAKAKKVSEVQKLGKIFTTIELQDATIDELQAAMNAGRLTSKKLTQMYIDRIHVYDESLKLNSIISVSPYALSEAAKFDRERKQGKVRGPLHGIPIIVKDNIDVKGIPTSAGSLALYHSVPDKDSFIIKKLRAAGAVILGKANLSEFASSAVDSESLLGGEVRNPYDTSRAPGGSSGGTAVAVTCNFCAAGLGTDTGGSIRIPSLCNNLYGIRPSKGLTSIAGVVPLVAEKDVTGPIARTPKDLSYMLESMSGTDPEDDYTSEAGADRLLGKGYSSYLSKKAMYGKRIGVFDGSINSHEGPPEEDVNTKTEETEEKEWYYPDNKIYYLAMKTFANLRKAGAELMDISGLISDDWIQAEVYAVIKSIEFSTKEYDINFYFHRMGAMATYRTLKQLIQSGLGINVSNLYGYDVDKLADSFEETQNPYTEIVNDYARTVEWQNMLNFRQKLDDLMKENNLDAILYLPMKNVPSTLLEAGSQLNGNGYIWIFGPQAGLPEIILPMGFADADADAPYELPSGMAVFGRFGAEKTLLQIAYAYQQQAGSIIRRTPSIVPALSDGKLNSFLKNLVKRVSKWKSKMLEKKSPIRFRLLETACMKASEANLSDPTEVYERALELAEAFDSVR